ncbi:microfibril-associated glycoprotein 4-like [Wyeomyia smithii]|uniref:microfibril-associated glycoprotein 4-like n=1 Tax=Wyeomyia smithii TaxID=174621 RepID=UPI002467AD9D|nr:microfibril-associated glycoprotein 4-like [Wyeomyia smithii]XP_055531646.1 microfibril-associated glycoprotein 4-like [Wyeomyia smithii]
MKGVNTLAFISSLFFIQSATTVEVTTVKTVQTETSNETVGFEVLLAKMDYLEYKFMELEYDIKEQNELMARNQGHLERSNEGMAWMVTRLDEALGRNFTQVLSQSWKILQQQKSCSNHENLRKAIFNLKPIKGPSDNVRMLFDLHQFKVRGPYDSCTAEPSKISGKYLLQPFMEDEPFVGFCEQTKFGGGWMVIQHRYDGSLDFYRNWTEYKHGFGDADKEYWIGLELLHKITSAKTYQLLVELEDFLGDFKYAKYSDFEVGNETEKYILKKVGTYTGTAGDSLTYHKGMKFTTLDSDNDANAANCAESSSGAWWYNNCLHSNLNGKYMNANDVRSVTWYHYKSAHYGLKYSRMLIREVN